MEKIGPSMEDGYENIGGGDHDNTEEIVTIDAEDDYEPEETYIIPNTVPVDLQHDKTVSYDMDGKE